MKFLRSDKVSLIVIVVTLAALAQLLYSTYAQRQITECQASVNSAFLETLKQRAQISDADRNATRRLVTTIATDQSNPEVIERGFQRYIETNRQLDELRASFTYPDIEGSC